MPTDPNEWGHAHDFDDVNGQVAICGVGDSDMSKASGRTTQEIVGQAVEREPTDVDGLMYVGMGEQFDVAAFHEHFGTSHEIWESNKGGGTTGAGTAPYF